MKKAVPESDWAYSVLNSRDYGLAQSRTRVFLRGVRTQFFIAVPPALEPWGSKPVVEFPTLGAPCTEATSLSGKQQENLEVHERRIRELRNSGDCQATAVVAFAVDRSAGRVFKQALSVDCMPTLTTHNRYLWVASVEDIDDPRPQRRFSRILLPSERFALQGLDPNLALALREPWH